MTFIHPHSKKTFLNRILAGLFVMLLSEALYLVVLYNNVVNTQHTLISMKEELRLVQTENAELKEDIFALFDTTHLRSLAEAKKLTEDRNPFYFEIIPELKIAER